MGYISDRFLHVPTKGASVSAASEIGRRWKPIVTGVLFGAAEAFFINKVSSENPNWWWWLLLGFALIGVIVCAIWAVLTPTGEVDATRGDNTVGRGVNNGGTVIQQSAGAKGQNTSVYADNGSFAANRVDRIDEINFGEPQQKDDSGRPERH